MRARAVLPLAAVAIAMLGLQGCEREPPRTIVTPPAASLPDDTPLGATEQRSGVDPGTATAAAPSGDQSTVAAAPEPAPVPPSTAEMGAPPAVPAPVEVRPAGDAAGAQLLAQQTLQVPVAGIQPSALTDNFEQRRGERKHEAIDILAPAGTPVVAVDDGRVAKLFTSKPGGLTVYQFDRSSRLAYYYAHLQAYAPGLREGMELKRGDLIGYVGSTGNADPNAPHLHFAVFRLGNPPLWWEGEAVNPYPALSRARASESVAAR